MSEVTYNFSYSEDLLRAIKKQLSLLYPDYNIYSDAHNQSIIEPCFLVRVISAKADKILARRFWYYPNISITALASGVTGQGLQTIREDLLFGMKEVPFRDLHLRPQEDNTEIIERDDSVFYTAGYKLLVKLPKLPDELMESLEYNIFTNDDEYKDAIAHLDEETGLWHWQDRSDSYIDDVKDRSEPTSNLWLTEEEKAKLNDARASKVMIWDKNRKSPLKEG